MSHKHRITENPEQLVGIAALAAGIGAVVAMLFAPRSGWQTRNAIKRRATVVKNDLEDHLRQAGETAEEAKDEVHDSAAEVVDNAKTVVKQTAKAVSEAKAPVKSTVRKSAAKPRTTRTPQA